MNLTEWHKSESNTYPELLDKTTSERYVIVRRNVQEIIREDATLYQYEEKMVLRDDWLTYEDIVINYNNISDNSDGLFDIASIVDENSQAIMELAEMIGGNE